MMKNIIKKVFVVMMSLCICMTFMLPAIAAEEECPEGVEIICPAKCDIDDNGKISAADARLALRYSVGLEEFTEEQIARADYDGDGKVKAADARMVLRTSVGLEDIPAHTDDGNVWAKDNKCLACGETLSQSKMSAVVDKANAWAEDIGVDAFVKGTAGEGVAAIELNVDGIWSGAEIDTAVFDGFLTAFGDAIEDYFGDADVAIDGKEVYKDGKLQNTAVKNALFDIGAGFFYKVANLAEDGVYGVYVLVIDGEEIELTVKFTGTQENLAKVKSFCQTISEHIAAQVVDGNLVIDVYAPDALKSVIIEKAGEDAEAALNELTIGDGLAIVNNLNVEDVFGSQASAVNKLCVFICQLSPFVNKVLSKTEATVAVADGEIAFVDGEFVPASGDFTGIVYGVRDVLSEELLATTVGTFANGEYYTVEVNLSVDMSSLGLMAGEIIEETVIVNIHVFDN